MVRYTRLIGQQFDERILHLNESHAQTRGRLRRAGVGSRPSLAIQAGYWWYFAAIGCLTPYIALYYRQLGLAGWEIGVLAAISPLGIALLSPLWGSLADTWSAHRLVLRCALVVAALAAFGMAAATSFVVLVPLVALLASALAAVPALLDGYAMTISEREGRAYGHLRIWGSFGYIAAVWVVGWWMGGTISTAFLFAYGMSLLLACSATLGLPRLEAHATQALWHGVAAIVRDRRVVLLLLTAYMVTACSSVMNSYFGIYLIDLGGTTQLVGTASVLAAISELPILAFGRWLLQRLSARRVLLIAIGAYTLRFAGYSVAPSPGWAVAVQLLHGLSFGMYLMSSITLMHELAGRERAATAQGVLSAIALGFGAITGSLVGGALLDRIGAVGIFQVATFGMALALLVYFFGLYRMDRAQHRASIGS